MNGSSWQRQHFLDMEENRWDSHVFDEEELGRDPFDEFEEAGFTVESLREMEERLSRLEEAA